MSYIEVIKKQFFSQVNCEFIVRMVGVDQTINTTMIKVMNTVWNSFLNNVYKNKWSINEERIEGVLVTINKMTIDSIIDDLQVPPLDVVVKTIPVQESIMTQTDLPSKTCTKKLDLFSMDSCYTNGSYKFDMKQHHVKSVIIDRFELHNNLYNITESNNRLELIENNFKVIITIPVGCYDIQTLLSSLEKLLTEKSKLLTKYLVLFNDRKNRISLSSESTFGIRFLESKSHDVPLRFMLGFTQVDYMNNNSYTTECSSCVDIYDKLYMKVKSKNSGDIFNAIQTSSEEFAYCAKYSLLQSQTFGRDVLCSEIYEVSGIDLVIDDLQIEFFIRNNKHEKFYRLTKQLNFSFMLTINC